MKAFKVTAFALCAGMIMASCTNLAKGTAIGAGGGAVLGAIIGNIAGNTAVGAAIGGAVGAGAGAIIGKKMDKAKAAAAQVANAQVESVTDANGYQAVKVTFDSGILFTTGSSTLSASAMSSLNKFANDVLKQNTDMNVGIVGYTDNQGWKNSTAEQSALKNQALSLQRAQAVTNYLTKQGVSTSQIKETAGLGEQNPVADNSTAAGQKQNRRVEVFLYASDEMIKQAEAGTLQ